MKNKTLIIILCVISAIAILCAGVFGTLLFLKSNKNDRESLLSNFSSSSDITNIETFSNNAPSTPDGACSVGYLSVAKNGLAVYKKISVQDGRADVILYDTKTSVEKKIHTFYTHREVDHHFMSYHFNTPLLSFDGEKIFWTEKGTDSLTVYDISSGKTDNISEIDSYIVLYSKNNIIYYLNFDTTATVVRYNLETTEKETVLENFNFPDNQRPVTDRYVGQSNFFPQFLTSSNKFIYSTLGSPRVLKTFDFETEKSYVIAEDAYYEYSCGETIYYSKLPSQENSSTKSIYSCTSQGNNHKELGQFDLLVTESSGTFSDFSDSYAGTIDNGTDKYMYSSMGYEIDLTDKSFEKIFNQGYSFTLRDSGNLYLLHIYNGYLNIYDFNNGYNNSRLLTSVNLNEYYQFDSENIDNCIYQMVLSYCCIHEGFLYIHYIDMPNDAFKEFAPDEDNFRTDSVKIISLKSELF